MLEFPEISYNMAIHYRSTDNVCYQGGLSSIIAVYFHSLIFPEHRPTIFFSVNFIRRANIFELCSDYSNLPFRELED